jgi:hypothetical protein
MKTKIEIEELTENEKVELILEQQQKLHDAEARINKQEKLHKIYRLWIRNREKLYPDQCRGESVSGIDLDTLHCTVDGCVTTFLSRETLSAQQIDYLYASNDDLELVTRELQDYEGFYFRQLQTIVSSIIEYKRLTEVRGEDRED